MVKSALRLKTRVENYSRLPEPESGGGAMKAMQMRAASDRAEKAAETKGPEEKTNKGKSIRKRQGMLGPERKLYICVRLK